MFQSDDPPAIPLWINGHAFLTMVPEFLDVCNPADGKVLRRTPLCGAGVALDAVNAAEVALPSWAALPASARGALLGAVGEVFSGYASHFVRLIVEESGKEMAQAGFEVGEVMTLLRKLVAGADSGVLGIVGDAKMPFLGPLQHAIPALIGGAVVVIRPSPDMPSALFAFAELTGLCGFPDGVFSILHGGQAAVDGLRNAGCVKVLYS